MNETTFGINRHLCRSYNGEPPLFDHADSIKASCGNVNQATGQRCDREPHSDRKVANVANIHHACGGNWETHWTGGNSK